MRGLLVMLLCTVLAEGGFYRYLDLTPVMSVLPRGEVLPELVGSIKSCEVAERGDSLILIGLDRGMPAPLFGLSDTILVVRSDSLTVWQMDDFCYRITEDQQGRPVLLERLASSGDQLPGSHGQVFSSWCWENDNTVTTSVLDSMGASLPVKVQPSTEAMAARVNSEGDLEYFRFGSRLAHGFRYVLDGHGRALIKEAVDSSGNVVVTSTGAASVRYAYDSDGNLLSTAYTDLNGNLIPADYALPLTGNWEFDSSGVVMNAVRIAYVRREFDGNSLYVSETNIGLDGLPVEDEQGRCLTVYDREEHGGISGCEWFSMNGEPVEVGGVWRTERIYDGSGRILETITMDASGLPAPFTGGFAITRFAYSVHRDPVLIAYFGTAGEPVINTVRGCHGRSQVLDAQGNIVEVRYLDTSYRLTENAEGVARTVFMYDSLGNPSGERSFDSSGMLLDR